MTTLLWRSTLCLIGLMGLLPTTQAAEAIDNFVCNAQRINDTANAIPGPHRLIKTEPSDTLMYEASRTTDVLDLCSRDRAQDGSEDYLYTWGLDKKIERMLSMDRLEYCAYDQARILTSTIVRLATTTNDPQLNLVLGDLARDLHAVPSKSYLREIVNRSFEQIEEVFAAQRERCGTDARCRASADGRLAGLQQVRSNPNGFISTGTNGPGVYFASDPVSFLEHKKTDQDIGLVCDLRTSQLRITDLALQDTEQALEALLIRIPAKSADLPHNTPAALKQTAPYKRQFFEPFHNIRAFEIAAHKRILRLHNRHNIYLDKCAIEYRTSCERLSVENLDDCSAIVDIQAKIEQLPQTVDAATTGVDQNSIDLGYYLIQEGNYRNTAELREALEQRRALRCAS